MKTSKIETQSIQDISPKKVEMYLKYKGWKKKKEVQGVASIWFNDLQPRDVNILLPLDKDFADFEIKIIRLIEVLSAVEERPEAEVLKALQSTSTVAKNENREIIDLKIQFFETDKHEAPAKEIGSVLKSTQDFFEALGNRIVKNVKKRFNKTSIRDELSLSLIDTFQGSFGIRVGMSNVRQMRLIDAPVSEQAAEEFIELVKASSGNDPQKLREEIKKIQGEPSIKFKNLIKHLMSLESDLVLEWGSVNPEKGAIVEFPSHKVVETFDIISKLELENPNLHEVMGTLILAGVGDRKDSRLFIIYDDKDNKEYKGHISQELINSLDENIEIDKRYKALIEETLKVNPLTGEEIKVYSLLQLEEIPKTNK
ncbi:hypothetical protein [Floridanema aerugineum]|uniref:Uncharacterized protein n=1 Tax=Floridaenema aerugineum BLCC-F46 TaxID=3153654 RepID=A0ABV4X2C8_9CYAN